MSTSPRRRRMETTARQGSWSNEATNITSLKPEALGT